MRNRWYHKPLLHSVNAGIDKRATWLELFYDLVFVAAFIQLGHGLGENISVIGFLGFAGMFVPLWVAWTGLTFFINRFTVDDFVHRMFVFVQMFAIGGMAISGPDVLDARLDEFSLSAGIALGCVGAMYYRAHRQVADGRAYCRYWGNVFFLAGLLWVAATVLPPKMAIPVWAIATLFVLIAPLSRQSRVLREEFPIDMRHLAERYGLLTIIVLGESFVEVLGVLVDERQGTALYLRAAIALLLTCGIWWIYFDDVAGSKVRSGRGQWMVWLYNHIPLQIGVIALAVALKEAIHFDFDTPAPEPHRWLLSGALALIYLGVAAIDSVTERRQAELSDRARVNARWISGLLILVLAPAGRTLSGGMFLLFLTGITVAQVVFDMMMAPFEANEAAEASQKALASVARDRAVVSKSKRRPRDISEAVRKDAPSELRRDLYFYFMEGSWTRVFASLGVIFLLVNVFFAALYLMEPGSVANAQTNSFLDAFFFSVQTMSTIGYGTLSPGTTYGQTVVTAEAAVSVIGIAVVTGLVFAKVSRPKAAVLFSKPLLLATHHGAPTLMFRAGNARGNDIVDATIDFTVIVEDISPEGHHLRRVRDLKLKRSRSPIFVLSWLVMHEIDEDSPLADIDWDHPEEHIVAFVATLVGHDGTYNQTVFARHVWHCDDLRHDHHFVDILSELDDGRLLIDYALFHDTQRHDSVP